MTNIKFLLIGTSLSFLPQTLNAQCVTPIQDCYALGYTQTSCPNGKGVKCPFGNGWYCGGTAAQDCIKLGYDKDCTGAGESGNGETCNGKYQSCTCDSTYQYTCSGTGYSGGSGTSCGGKYTSCTCTSGYEWKDGTCQIIDNCLSNCSIGCLYYSDNSCASYLINSKILLGVVIYEKSLSEDGWIMTISPIAKGIAWDTGQSYKTGITGTSPDVSCSNTAALVAKGSRFEAANKAYNYNAGGRTWCLPSYDLLKNLTNSTNFTNVNNGIKSAGGILLGYGGQPSYSYENVWSSSEASDTITTVFYADINGGNSMGPSPYKYNNWDLLTIRPVTAF